jgi:hypothetical protein
VKPPDHLITRTLDDGLIVAPLGGHRLFVMNGSARFIWEQRANGADDSNIPSLMADRYGIGIRQAQSDFRKTLRRWQAEGLAGPAGSRRHYKIGSIGFSVDYPDRDIEVAVAPILDHMELAASKPPRGHYEREFAIGAEAEQMVLRVDGIDLLWSHALDDIIERLVAEIVTHACDNINWLMSTHAAAVGTHDACILMPGASGAGKSTLTASLLMRPQIRYLTDDIALLDRENLHVVPVPGALVLKSGSWELLGSLLPALASRTIHRRHDEDVRYWAPPPARIANTPLPVRAVVFPRRSDQAEAVLTPLSPLEGLNQIISAPATISPPITLDTVDRLAQWARRTPFYTLAYGRLEGAAAPIEMLLGK